MKKSFLLLLFLPLISFGQQKPNTMNTHILKNKNLQVYIDVPEENYQKTRFDWTGKIVAVIYKGVPVVTTEKINGENENDFGKGMYNEFGIESPIGFDDITEGEYFHKIGIGLLQKEGEEYQFYKDYNIQPAQFKIKLETNKLIIECTSEEVNGYAYVLKKEFELKDDGFVIHYKLDNTGERNIKTDEYTHNFLSINKELIGSSYILRFPFPIKPELFWASVNPENKVEIGSNVFSFNGRPEEQFFFSNLSGDEEVEAHWELINTQAKLGLSETGSFKTSKVNLWGWKHVISPELFFEINLRKGETVEWSRTYRVFDVE